MNSLKLISIILFSIGSWSVASNAVTRSILIPGKTAIILMEGMSSSGVDLEARNLYDALAVVPIQQAGGEAKILKTTAKDFNFICATKNTTRESVVCNIAIKPSPNSQIQATSATFKATGTDAADLFEKCAGPHATSAFHYESANHQVRINSSREVFEFSFHQ